MNAAGRLGLAPAEQQTLRFAALAHDLGRVGISTAIWDKPARLTDGEWESVRLHAYYAERMLLKVPALAEAARLAGAHHEQCDGSGYHRGSRAQPVLSCLLAAADAYVAMRNARAWRPALDPGQAGAELRALGGEGKLEQAAVNAVLAAAGDTGPRVRRTSAWPDRPRGGRAAADHRRRFDPAGRRGPVRGPRPWTSTCRTSMPRPQSRPGPEPPCSRSRTTCCPPDRAGGPGQAYPGVLVPENRENSRSGPARALPGCW